MPIRLIVTDLDGTLLRNDKTVSPRTLAALNAARARGIKFVIATARPIRAVEQWLPPLPWDAAVYHNGAVIRDFSGALRHIGIERPAALARNILAAHPDAHISLEAEDCHYANYDADRIWPGMEFVRTADFRELENAVADKLLIEAHSPAELARYEPHLPTEVYLQLSEGVVAMGMHRDATKLNAVRLLAGRLGIGLEEVAAFGDDYNDLELLAACGRGVAVANALPEVRTAAGETCLSNEADGVADWLEKNLSV